MKLIKRLCLLGLVLAVIVGVCSAAVFANDETGITYLDAEGNVQVCSDYETVADTAMSWGTAGT